MRREDGSFAGNLEKEAGRHLARGSNGGTDRHLTENPGRGADRHSEKRPERKPGSQLARSLDKGEDWHLAERPERNPGGHRTENPGWGGERLTRSGEPNRGRLLGGLGNAGRGREAGVGRG